ncbi:MFS transporter [Pseudonocardia sp. DSM 45834]|uniref:MFS transporter n=1 Tax=Pseudonocardia charpentierae TaxID=3075545 RepID=A0ABU2NFY9_9PSEU|nr:MFS transporter [Pseudonocardia sp. DSM 45834]MDT0352154.1 MFS transporter [Pseudonocardia sp. DSM 45834]
MSRRSPGTSRPRGCNEKLDRRRTIAIYLVGSAISAFLLSQSDTSPTIVTSGALLSFFLNGVYAGLYAYTPEVFPTWVRSTATGMSSAFGRIGSITAPAIIGFFAAALGFAGVFTMTTAVLLVGVAVVLVFGLSTAAVAGGAQRAAGAGRGRVARRAVMLAGTTS